MPITPFHFGPGALLTSVAPAHVSWTAFALSNALIDLEPIVLYFVTGDPAHPWLHTPPGALAVAAVAALLGRKPCEAFLRWWNSRLSPGQVPWLSAGPAITAGAAWTGALLGTSSHILLDGFMHGDVRPFWPLHEGNPIQGLVALDWLHGSCVFAGLLGVAILTLRRRQA